MLNTRHQLNRYVWGKWLHCKKIVRKGILIELLKYMCPGMRVCDKVTPVIAERQSLRGIFMEYSSNFRSLLYPRLIPTARFYVWWVRGPGIQYFNYGGAISDCCHLLSRKAPHDSASARCNMLCSSGFGLRVNVTRVHIGDRSNTVHVSHVPAKFQHGERHSCRQCTSRPSSLPLWKRRASVTRITFRIGTTEGPWPYPPEALDWSRSPCRHAAIITTIITVLPVWRMSGPVVCHHEAFSVW